MIGRDLPRGERGQLVVPEVDPGLIAPQRLTQPLGDTRTGQLGQFRVARVLETAAGAEWVLVLGDVAGPVGRRDTQCLDGCVARALAGERDPRRADHLRHAEVEAELPCGARRGLEVAVVRFTADVCVVQECRVEQAFVRFGIKFQRPRRFESEQRHTSRVAFVARLGQVEGGAKVRQQLRTARRRERHLPALRERREGGAARAVG